MISPIDYFFKEPIYKAFEYSKEDFENIFGLIFFSGNIDNYCPDCKKDSIFKSNTVYVKSNKQTSSFSPDLLYSFNKFSEEKSIDYFKDMIFESTFTCERQPYSKHVCKFYTKFNTVDYTKTYFQKIGQHPSIADLNDYKTKKFSKVLSKEKFNELNKGIGLAGHGVGIGSFVYFRRIFEDLIHKAYNDHKSIIETEYPVEKFNTLKMNNKIEVLKPFIPEFIYDNRILYGILSKGIHQLDESECLEKYRMVELGIRLILEDKLVEYDKKMMVEEFNKLKSKS